MRLGTAVRSSVFLVLVLACAGPALTRASARPASQAAACGTGVGCQLPDQQGWSLSDDNPGGGLVALDNLRVTADGAIRSLCWWGAYYDFNSAADCGPGTGDEFTITYYDDENCTGMPASLRAGPFPVALTARFATGNVASGSGIVLAEYQYEATHPPVDVSAGECLWIEILNHSTQSCLWLWSSAAPADAHSLQGGVFGYSSQRFDLAFCVDVATTDDGCARTLATTYCTAKPNSSGCTPSIQAGLQGSHLLIGAEQVLADRAGLLFYGVNGASSTPFQGGFLCVQSPLERTAAQQAGASGLPPCTGTLAFDFTAYAESGADAALTAGQQVWAQYWTRDGGAPFASGLTDGLTFVLCP